MTCEDHVSSDLLTMTCLPKEMRRWMPEQASTGHLPIWRDIYKLIYVILTFHVIWDLIANVTLLVKAL